MFQGLKQWFSPTNNYSARKKDDDLEAPLLQEEKTASAPPAIQAQSSSLREKVIVTTGLIGTKLAMVGQGIFAALLIAKFMKKTGKLYIPLTIAFAPIIGYASYLGKFALVWYFARNTWRALANRSMADLLNDIDPSNWRWDYSPNTKLPKLINHLLGIVNVLFSINMAYVFAGLTVLSLNDTDGAGHLSEDIGWEWGKTHIFSTLWLNIPLTFWACFSNLLCWSGIHHGGIFSLNKILSDFAGVFTRLTTEDYYQIHAVSHYFSNLINHENQAQFDDKLDDIVACFRKESPEMQRQAVFNYYEEQKYDLMPYLQRHPSYYQGLTHWLSGVAGIAICALGFINFLDMHAIINPAMPYILQKIFGVMTYSSMLLLAMTVYDPVRTFTRKMTNNFDPYIQCYSQSKQTLLCYWTVFMCVIGGTPNLFQALLDDESLFLAILSVAASFLVEMPTLSKIYDENASEKPLRESKYLQWATTGVALFQEMRDHSMHLPSEDSVEQFLSEYKARYQ